MRKTTIIISSCIVLLLLSYTGYRGYKVWKQEHWLTMAKGFAAKADARNEVLCLRQVLGLNSQNLEACHLMAELADAARSQDALIWRQRLVDLNPNSLADRLALAQTALSFSAFAIASNALAGVDDLGQKTAVYQNAAGLLAAGAGQTSAAETHFAEAIRLDVGNPIPQLNLAALQLHSSNALDVAEARINLKRISLNSTNLTIRNQAKRELLTDALHNDDYGTAEALAKELAQATNAVFADRLLRLEVLQQAKSPEFPSALSIYQHEAAATPAKLSNMALWLMQKKSPAESLAWLQSLPGPTQTNQPAATLIAQCQIHLGQWHRLQTSIQNQNWTELEFVRHAFLARALHGQELQQAATSEWSVALNLASDQKGALISLFRLSAEWQWRSEAEELLWILVNRYPEERWAAPVLMQTLMNGGRTRPLMQLFGVLSRRTPTDLEMKNNLAFTALLLGANELNPYALAQAAYAGTPKNPSFAATYAYSLYLQKKNAEALKVMQQLAAQDLANPAIAGYYGLILKATGNAEKARSYLNLALKVRLLPEEQTLFQQALMN